MQHIVIKNGTVIDPGSGLHGQYDIVIAAGKIISVELAGRSYEACTAGIVVDAQGCVVTPGLIDLHTHIFPEHTSLGIQADRVGVEQGVTTVLDAGSSGRSSFAAFQTEVVEKSKTRVLAWLNIADQGLCGGRSELADLNCIHVDKTAALIREYPIIRGVKVRMSSSVLGGNLMEPLLLAKQAAVAAAVPVMVHVGNGPPALGRILDLLEAGDVVTHAFHGKAGGIFTADGQLIPEARAALERNVIFDVGHGTSSFSFQTMRQAVAAGIDSYSISTDIYRENYHGPVFSLTATLSKFLALGCTLEQVIKAATVLPATILGLDNELGSLAVGARADISILALKQGAFEFYDSENQRLTGSQLLQPKYVIQSGRVLTCK